MSTIENEKVQTNTNLVECAVQKTLETIGGKWTCLIISLLLSGPKRFGELLKHLEGSSPKTMSIRLKELEQKGIITRRIFPEIPPHVEYSLTPKGKDLETIFNAMLNWKQKWY